MTGPQTAQNTYDVSLVDANGTPKPIRFAIDENMRAVSLDFMDDFSGNPAGGSVTVYIGDPGGLPFAVVRAGDLLNRLISAGGVGTFLTIIPLAGSKGLLHVCLVRHDITPGRYR